MCGRFTITITLEELVVRFNMERSVFPNYRTRYNVAPGQMIMAIIHDGHANRLGELQWGLVPSWAKDKKIGNNLINARAETVNQKPAYRLPFERKRCIIPADSFYEWQKTPSGKQPMRIQLHHGELFAMAGLYDTWLSPDGSKLSTCTIITTEANTLIAPIHNRMPVILRPEDERDWLDRSNRDPSQLLTLLRPFPAHAMKAYPVSPLVGNANNDFSECIQEVTNGGLFE